MKLYITNLSLYVLIFLYLPIVVWALWRIGRSLRLRGARKAGVLMLAVLVAYAIPLGDVTINSLAMAKVCPSAGLHVYKTVEVDGYITTLGDGDTLNKYPYKFIETPQLQADGTYYWRHYRKGDNAKVTVIQLSHPTAAYEVLRADGYAKFNGFELPGYDKETHTSKSRWVIRNRVSGEILAEWLFFRALPGWLDSVLVYRWFGSGGSFLSCTARSDFSGWPEKVLLPKQSTN